MKVELLATPDQVAVINSPARTKLLCACRRWGKSTVAGLYLVQKAVTHPGSIGMYVSPSYNRSMSQLRLMLSCPGIHALISKVAAQWPPRIIWPNKAETHFRSCDRPDNLRGACADLMVVDEAAYVPENTYHAVLRPMVSDRRGTIMTCSTLNGLGWWTTLFEKVAAGKADGHAWKFPAQTAMCFQGAAGRAELESIRQSMPRASFEQEYLCLPSAGSAQVFPADKVELCTRGRLLDRAEPGRRYVICADLGKTADPTAVVVIDDQGCTRYTRAYPLGTEHSIIAGQLAAMSRAWSNAVVVIDATAGAGGGYRTADTYLRFYRQKLGGVLREFIVTQRSKQVLIETATLWLEQGKASIPADCTQLLGELKSYQYRRGRFADILQFGAPEGCHDDMMFAWLLGIHALDRNWLGGAALDVGPG